MTQKEVVENDDNTILKFRVERSVVRDFPFDILYLVPFAQKAVLPKLFPWSLCIPPQDTFIEMIQQLYIHDIETLPYKGRKEVQHSRAYRAQVDYAPIGIKERFIVVPILPLVTDVGTLLGRPWANEETKSKHKRPPYLVAPRHAKLSRFNRIHDIDLKTDSRFAFLLTDDVVLFTPDGPVRPVCRACPRHMLHVLGKCQLGCQLCFEELILRRAPDEQLPANETDTPASP